MATNEDDAMTMMAERRNVLKRKKIRCPHNFFLGISYLFDGERVHCQGEAVLTHTPRDAGDVTGVHVGITDPDCRGIHLPHVSSASSDSALARSASLSVIHHRRFFFTCSARACRGNPGGNPKENFQLSVL